MVRLLIILLLCRLGNVVGTNTLDGGATGDDESPFLDGTATTEKISLGLNCVKDSPTATAVEMQFYVNQGDDGFKFEDASTTLRASQLVIYESCFFIDTKQYVDAGELIKATANAACGNSIYFTTLNATETDTSLFEARTKHATLTITNPALDGSFQCGSMKDGTDIVAAVYCKRDLGFDKAFDVVFKATYSSGDCLATAVDVNQDVEDVPTVEVKYNLEVSMKAYARPSGAEPSGPESLPANEISAPIDLGAPMYLEICLRIPEVVASATDINNQFFNDNGFGIIGVQPHSCVAKPEAVDGSFQESVNNVASWPEIVDSNGCGGAQPGSTGFEEYFRSTEYSFTWLKDLSNSQTDHLLSPNCVRTKYFPAISGARLDIMDQVATKFTCKLSYCTQSSDNKCFAEVGDSPTCPPTARRKRSTLTVGQNLPDEASVAITVIIQDAGANSTVSAADRAECFQKNTFIGISAVMGTLFLAVVLAAILLAVRLGKDEPENSTDSMTGIQNKAYY